MTEPEVTDRLTCHQETFRRNARAISFAVAAQQSLLLDQGSPWPLTPNRLTLPPQSI